MGRRAVAGMTEVIPTDSGAPALWAHAGTMQGVLDIHGCDVACVCGVVGGLALRAAAGDAIVVVADGEGTGAEMDRLAAGACPCQVLVTPAVKGRKG